MRRLRVSRLPCSVQPTTDLTAAQDDLRPSRANGRTARPKNQWTGFFQQNPPNGHLDIGQEVLFSIFFSFFLFFFSELDIQTKPDHEVEIGGVVVGNRHIDSEVEEGTGADGV